jgi:hypothetical protein
VRSLQNKTLVLVALSYVERIEIDELFDQSYGGLGDGKNLNSTQKSARMLTPGLSRRG